MAHRSWKLEKQQGIPLYKQIVQFIVHKIAQGDLVVGDRLPTQRELAQQLEVNRSTIVAAMEELKAMGLIEGFHGEGTKIINNTWSSLLSLRTPNWNQYISESIHENNLPTVQAINRLEFEPDIIRLGTGELSPSLFPKDMFQEILRNLSLKVTALNYLEPRGLEELRVQISRYLGTMGIQAPPSNILVVSGALQGLQLIAQGILAPGSRVYVETPSYLKSLQVFQSLGMHLQGVEMDREGIIPWQMHSHNGITEILYTIPTFHNPTGITMGEKRREELLQWCKGRQLPIIEDDCYRELWIDGPPPLSLKARDTSGMVLYLGSISKSLAPGLRLGWLVGPESVINHLSDIKMQMDYGASSISQWILSEWLATGMYHTYVSQLRGHLKERRDLTLQLLAKHMKDLATWEIPAGGFYIWLRLKRKISTDRLFHAALKKKILLNPGSIYDFSKNNFLRLSYSYASLDQLEVGIATLAKIIERGL